MMQEEQPGQRGVGEMEGEFLFCFASYFFLKIHYED